MDMPTSLAPAQGCVVAAKGLELTHGAPGSVPGTAPEAPWLQREGHSYCTLPDGASGGGARGFGDGCPVSFLGSVFFGNLVFMTLSGYTV